jgi:hypothetical protein
VAKMAQTHDRLVKVFISCGPENLRVARLLKDVLERININIDTFLSGADAISKGANWRDEFARHLETSDYFILIAGSTNNNETQWQGFETGYYEQRANPGSTFVIYDPGTLPPSFALHIQTIPATSEDLFRFIIALTKKINSARAPIDEIERAAAQAASAITQQFVGGISSQLFSPMLTISLDDPNFAAPELLKLATVRADSTALRLLNLPNGNWTLDDIKNRQDNQDWINELIGNVSAVAQGRLPTPAMHILHKGPDNYLPALYSVERGTGRGLSITVAFIEWRGKVGAFLGHQHAFFGQPVASKLWPDVFVAMPFADELEPIYRDHITKVVKTKCKVSLGRADDFYTNHAIMQDVWSAIFNAKVIIADCTGRNPNVFYEIGMSHTLERPTILIAQKSDDIPFDIRHVRAIIYTYTPRGMVDFERKLEETLHSVMDEH